MSTDTSFVIVHDTMTHLLQVRAALGIEIRTGMGHSKGSILALCQRLGYTDKRTKKGAWKDVDALITANGGPATSRPIT